MKTKEQIFLEVKERVTQEWLKTGPICDFVGVIMDCQIANQTEFEFRKQQEQGHENPKHEKNPTQYDK